MAEFVNICACYAGLAESFGGADCDSGNFALIRLVGPNGYRGQISHVETREVYPENFVLRAEIASDGCWRSSDLPLNSDLNPLTVDGEPLTYYEVAVFINGTQLGVERFLLDGNTSRFPAPPQCVNLGDVTWNSVPADASNFFSDQIHKHETPFMGVPGVGIEIYPGDVTTGDAGNNHQPIIQVQISDCEENALTGLVDGLYVSPWDCEALSICSIRSLGDVNCDLPSNKDIMYWDDAAGEFVHGPLSDLGAVGGGLDIPGTQGDALIFDTNTMQWVAQNLCDYVNDNCGVACCIVQWCVIDANNEQFQAYQVPNEDGTPGQTRFLNASGVASTPVAPLTAC